MRARGGTGTAHGGDAVLVGRAELLPDLSLTWEGVPEAPEQGTVV